MVDVGHEDGNRRDDEDAYGHGHRYEPGLASALGPAAVRGAPAMRGRATTRGAAHDPIVGDRAVRVGDPRCRTEVASPPVSWTRPSVPTAAPAPDGGRQGAPTPLVASVRRARRALTTEIVHRTWEWAALAGAIGPGDRRGRRFGALGEGSFIAFPQGTIFNEAYIEIGAGTMVGPYASLTAGMGPGQQMLTSPVVRIGERCVIGRGTHVVGHWAIDIGDDVQTGPHVYITDQNHSYTDPDEPIGRQCPVDAGVSIGAGSWLGAHAVVLPGAVVGRHVVVAAGAVVRGTVPDHCVVAGVPARIVRRWFADRGWVDARDQGPASARAQR